MAEQQIRFDDGKAYELSMGIGSRLAGEAFLDWFKISPGFQWLDVGCGNGALTELLIQRCAPREVHGILIHRKANSPSRAHVPQPVCLISVKAMPWRCPMQITASTWR